MTDFVTQVKEFNEIAGTPQKYNSRKLALYIGLILEEVSELIESLNSGDGDLRALNMTLQDFSGYFKTGKFDDHVKNNDRVETLDACVDIAVVALGGAIANGSDVIGACNEVAESNLSKFPFDESGNRQVFKDKNGKVAKPPSYRKPELLQFLV